MKPRENWGSRLGFLMATAGSAIGLGSLWKFPYVTGENGGGLFVLAYLFFTFLIGIPIFIAELLIGRTAAQSPVGAYNKLAGLKKKWRFVGWSSLLGTFLVLSFYTVVAGWALNYSLMSLLNFTANKTSAEISNVFNQLYQAPGINMLWSSLFLAITTAIVFGGIRKGIEFWAKILTPALFILLFALFLYSTSLEGFTKAVSFIFSPNTSRFTSSSLLQALGMACFTLSVGMGIILTYGSYMKKSEDIVTTSITVALINIGVSLLAALMIFPIIFTFNFSPEEGPGLLFKTLPILFNQLPGSLILSSLFFILVVFSALTSTISIMEVQVATITEVWGPSRAKASLIAAGITLLLSIPSALSGSGALFKDWPLIFGKTFFDTVDYFCFTWLLPINAILTSLFAGWVIKNIVCKQGFSDGGKWKFLFTPWLFAIRFIVPIAIIIIILQQGQIINIDRLFS